MTRSLAMLTALLTTASVVSTARAQRSDDTDAVARSAWRLSVAPTIGGLLLDPDLANYRWDTSPTMQPGVCAALHRSWLAAGMRAAWAGTSQATALPGETTVPQVNLTQVDLTLEARVVSLWSVELWASGHGGRLFLGYEPDQLSFDAGGPTPITVVYKPISEWCYGAGLAFRRDVARHLALGLQVEETSFQLDTAHRRGNEIVESRDRFTNWSISLAVLGFADLD